MQIRYRFGWASTALIAALVVVTNAFPQESLTAIVGTVQSVTGNQIHFLSGEKSLMLDVDDHTEIWKGKALPDLSQLEMGDDIWARYRKRSGKLVAEAVWINIVNYFTVITKVNGGTAEVLTYPNADPHSGYTKENKSVRFDGDTMFESSEKDDLKIGREVQTTVGLDLKNGIVKATRVTIYERKRPVRSGRVKVIRPDGTIVVIGP
jgi:hypothetical protein